ncbi:MAG: hypothetical protein ACIAXF_11415 [Phycisphaerales bacterium JB063]
MRVPTTKIYRAFAELDDLTDEQCILLMRRVRLRVGTNLGVGFLLTILYVVLLVLTVIAVNAVGMLLDPEGAFGKRHEFLLGFVVMFLGFGIPAAITMGVRDYVLRKRLTSAINYEIDRVRCLACKYILIGQVARDGHVVCPECGARQHLAELGITEADLIPPKAIATPA